MLPRWVEFEEKLIEAKSEQAQNQRCINKLRSTVENCIENKCLPCADGLAIKETLKEKLEQAKEDASQAILLLLNREDLGSPTPSDDDIQVILLLYDY